MSVPLHTQTSQTVLKFYSLTWRLKLNSLWRKAENKKFTIFAKNPWPAHLTIIMNKLNIILDWIFLCQDLGFYLKTSLTKILKD